jgi:hypothetical protein
MVTAAVRPRLAWVQLPIRFSWVAVALLLCALTACLCVAQEHDVVCSNGDDNFRAEFRSGVTVEVKAARAEELAIRSCEATLSWNKSKLVVARSVPQIDVDAFGVDLGLGTPVTAFQVKKSANDCCMEYQVYSLEKPPRLLRMIRGGDYFRAADTDLDGRLEIWTHDSGAVEGFEHMSAAEFDASPAIVLRFEHGQMLDVSSEFQDYFDREIAGVREELDAHGLHDFKSSDGKLLPNTPLPVERLHRLRKVKAKVLEIVWSYLYSGREQEGWRALAEMWPDADVARIQTAIVNARRHGIKAQIDGESSRRPRNRQKKVHIFDAIKAESGKLEVIPPVPIMLRRPAPPGTQSKSPLPSETLLALVIDSAGKVRSAEPAGKTQVVDQELINAAYSWKFIPAFKGERAVASRIRMKSYPKQ